MPGVITDNSIPGTGTTTDKKRTSEKRRKPSRKKKEKRRVVIFIELDKKEIKVESNNHDTDPSKYRKLTLLNVDKIEICIKKGKIIEIKEIKL